MPTFNQADVNAEQGAVDAALPFSEKINALIKLLVSQGSQPNAGNVNRMLDAGVSGNLQDIPPVSNTPLNLTGDAPQTQPQPQIQQAGEFQGSPIPAVNPGVGSDGFPISGSIVGPGDAQFINPQIPSVPQRASTEPPLPNQAEFDPTQGNFAQPVQAQNGSSPSIVPFIGEGAGGLTNNVISNILAALGLGIGGAGLGAATVRGNEDVRQKSKLDRAREADKKTSKPKQKGARLESSVARQKKSRSNLSKSQRRTKSLARAARAFK